MTSLEESSRCDNVLLEWSLALVLSQVLGTRVLPIFVGPMREDGRMDNLFAAAPPPRGRSERSEHQDRDDRDVFDRVPDVVVRSVVDRLCKFCGEAGLEIPSDARSRTARQVVQEMKTFLGVPLWDHTNLGRTDSGGLDALWHPWSSLSTVVPVLHNAVVRAAAGSARAPASAAACPVEGLAELLADCKVSNKLPAALAWCEEQGAASVDDIIDAELQPEFLAALHPLKKIPEVKLMKKLKVAPSSSNR